ncbi:hypothetical protein BC831DRAFT_474239 [Entophlyctis helioformis]|nr:hypothetical protein BC831DRAFT_474239 [Entophlyctis helioformis]
MAVWLVTHRDGICTRRALDAARRNGHARVAQFLRHRLSRGALPDSLDDAAMHSDLKMLRLLHANGAKCSSRAMDWAAHYATCPSSSSCTPSGTRDARCARLTGQLPKAITTSSNGCLPTATRASLWLRSQRKHALHQGAPIRSLVPGRHDDMIRQVAGQCTHAIEAAGSVGAGRA